MPPRKRRTTARKTTTARKSTTSRAAKPAPIPPVVGPGERLYVLSVPFEERGVANANGARWDPYHRQTIYVGTLLPYGLTPYASPDYSWERYLEDDLNGSVAPTQPSAMRFTPRPHQTEAVTKIASASARGYRGFLEADDVGLGKTISSWLGAVEVAKQRGAAKVLVMCPKGVIPHWRRTIAALGDHGLQVVVINYDQAKKLLTIPDSASSAARTRTKNKAIASKGQPVVDWDIVLLDEAHKCFPYDTLIDTDAGRIPIGLVVEEELDVRVLCRDDETGETVYRPITHRFCRPHAAPLVRVVHELGEFKCTDDHPIWTEEYGYVAAGELATCEGEGRSAEMRDLREGVLDLFPRSEDSQDLFEAVRQPTPEDAPRPKAQHGHNCGSDLCSVREEVRSEVAARQQASHILLDSMQRDLSHRKQRGEATAWREGSRPLRDHRSPEQGQEDARPQRASQAVEPDAQSRDRSQDGGQQEGADLSFARREWAANGASTATPWVDGVPDGTPNRLAEDVADRTGGGESPDLLQGGSGAHRIDDRHRGGRQFAPHATLAVLGQEEGARTRPSRVVRVEVLERGGPGGPRSSGGTDRRVYNVEVAEHHNYFANGALVHNCKNQSSQRTQAAARIARYAAAAKTAPFVIWMSATAGQNPTELAYLAPLFAQLTGATKTELKDFGQWLSDQGFCVSYNDRFKKWDWGLIPEAAAPAEVAQIMAHRERDLSKIYSMLFAGADAPSIRRLPTDIAGWPEVQRIAHPVDLDREQRRLYEEAWTVFRSDMRLFARGRDPKGGMAARLRFRQKASLIRVPGTVDLILDMLDNGHQVAVSVEFHETSDAIREALEAAKVPVAEFSGRNSDTREMERIAFQRGQRTVMLFSVTEAISLHQGEQLPDGTAATDVPRASVVHDPRYSGLDSIQIEGRTHRDGQAANVYYTFGAGTVEEQIVRTLVGRILSTKAMAGDDVSAVRELEAVLEEAALGEPVDAGEPAPSPAPSSGQAGSPPSSVRGGVRAPTPVVGQRTSAGSLPTKRPVAAPQTARTAPTTRTAPATRRAPSAAAPPPQQRRPRVDASMTPEERAFREALAGKKVGPKKKPATSAERQAFRDSLRD